MQRIKICFVIVICFFATGKINAQTNRIRSLESLIHAAPDDKVRLHHLLDLCAEFHSLNPDTSNLYALQAKAIAEKEKDQHSGHLADYFIAQHFLTAGNSDSSLKLASQLLQSVTAAGDKECYIDLVLLKARALNNTNQIKESLAILYPLLNDAEKSNDVLTQIRATNLMQGAYVAMGEDLRAQELCYKVLNLAGKNYPASWTYDVCISIGNLCLTYMHLNEAKGQLLNMDSARKYNDEAIAISRDHEFLSTLAYNLGLKGTMLGYSRKIAEGEETLKQSLGIYKQVGNKYAIVNCLSMLGNFYGVTNQPLKGIEVCKEGIEISKGSRPNLYIYANLAGNYKLAGNYLEYGNTMNELLIIKDSMYKVNSAEALSKLQTEYELQKKENMIIQQKLDINNKNNLFYGSLILLAITIGVGWTILFIRKKNQAIRLNKMQLAERKNATEAILQAEENERKRIAADLHDSVAQKMVVAKLNLETLEQYLPDMNNDQQHLYNNILSLVDESCADVRNLSHSMMPHAFFNSGLSAAVKNFTDQVEQKDFKVKFHTEGESSEVSNNVQIMVYRIIQECVQNVLKHAKATRLDISIIYTGSEMDVTIEDNGIGFDPDSATEGIGMQNIRSRIDYLNGTMDVQSTPGKGSAFTFYIPAKQL